MVAQGWNSLSRNMMKYGHVLLALRFTPLHMSHTTCIQHVTFGSRHASENSVRVGICWS